jgi:hypothetical protein
MSKYEKQCMGVVNQLYDLVEVPVDKRQAFNDKAFDYMMEQGKKLTNPSPSIEFQKALGLLRDLADVQNGAPLETYREEWEAIMEATHKFLSEHEEI